MKRLAILLGLMLATPLTASAAQRLWPTVTWTNFPGLASTTEFPAELDIHPPPGGCGAEPGGAAHLEISGGGVIRVASLTCRGHGPLPRLPGLSLRGVSSSGVGIGFFPDIGPYNYSFTYRMTITLDHRTLFQGHVKTSMFWAPNTRVWQGTDQFVNYCIDHNRPLYSSDLKLYCNDPAVEYGHVEIFGTAG